MDKKITILGAAVSALLAKQPETSTPVPQPEIDQARAILTPELVVLIADNKMPDCFNPDRASYVAMAQLLRDALVMIERMVEPSTYVEPVNPRVQ